MTTTTSSPIVFVVWERRPAVLVGGKAFAVLKPGGPWVSVDELDVAHTAAVMPEAAWREYFYVNTTSSDRLVARLIAGLSAEGIAYGQRCEWIAGYPQATEAEVQILIDAEKKACSPPCSLAHARLVLADNVYAFRPALNSPFDRSRNFWAAFHHWRPSGEPRSL
jgi:hypothetical protein